MSALPFFENSINSGMATTDPNQWYRGLQQAFISSAWDNTTSIRRIIGEQEINTEQDDYYQNFVFNDVEAWVDSVVGQSSTGNKTGRDFVRLIFEDINHPKLEGRYYIVDNQYYISYFDDRVVDVDANLSVRRCNEWMKIIDPMNGSIYQIPCVVDYDMSAPANKVTTPIITPNNHAVVKVQQNATTDRLFVTNARFILGNRPFKITGMQNATNQFIDNGISSLMEIDLFLDEIWDKDDIVAGIADNGAYDYSIVIADGDMELTNGAQGSIYADIILNGEEVQRPIIWTTSDETVVTVDDSGQYEVVGEIGQSATIKVNLYGNVDVFDSVVITIVDMSVVEAEVVINPAFTTIREHETMKFSVFGQYNGDLITPDNVVLTLPPQTNGYVVYTQNLNEFTLTCLKRNSQEMPFTFNISNKSPEFTANKIINVKLTSLLG